MEKIEEMLNMEPSPPATLDVPVTTVIPATVDNVEDQDFEIARANTYELLDMSKAALNTALRIAAESENPRAIEVLSGLLKNASEINRQLVQMSKDRQEVKIAKKSAKEGSQNPGVPQIQSQNTIVFSGNSSDILNLINKEDSK